MTFLKKILLVDHEPRVTALVRRALESTGRFLVKVEDDVRLAQHAAPWFRPDLVLLDANPLENIDNTGRISAVVLKGRLLRRSDLDKLLQDAQQLANQN